MEGLEYFHTVILHWHLEVWCDHKPLMHLMDQPHLTAKQARWIHRLSPYLPFTSEDAKNLVDEALTTGAILEVRGTVEMLPDREAEVPKPG